MCGVVRHMRCGVGGVTRMSWCVSCYVIMLVVLHIIPCVYDVCYVCHAVLCTGCVYNMRVMCVVVCVSCVAYCILRC